MNVDPLLHPSPATTPSPSVSTVSVRLAFFSVLLALALFANHDSSKHIDISFTSASASSPLARRRFDLLFVSNGRAQRVILDSAARIQEILCSSDHAYPRNTAAAVVNHVVVQLATHNLPGPATGSGMGKDPIRDSADGNVSTSAVGPRSTTGCLIELDWVR